MNQVVRRPGWEPRRLVTTRALASTTPAAMYCQNDATLNRLSTLLRPANKIAFVTVPSSVPLPPRRLVPADGDGDDRELEAD